MKHRGAFYQWPFRRPARERQHYTTLTH
jgi:hypothetical protein